MMESDCLARRVEGRCFQAIRAHVGQFIGKELERDLRKSGLPALTFNYSCTPYIPKRTAGGVGAWMLELKVFVTGVDAIVINPERVRLLRDAGIQDVVRHFVDHDSDIDPAQDPYPGAPRYSVAGKEILRHIEGFFGRLVDEEFPALALGPLSNVDFDWELQEAHVAAILAGLS